MPQARPIPLTLLLLVWASLAAAQAPAANPALRFAKGTVEAQGLTPSGTVIWFGVQKSVVAYEVTFSRVRQVGTADAKGAAVLALDRPLETRSVWVAVDLASGAYALAAPPGFPLVRSDLAPAAVASRGAALPDQLSDRADYAEVLLVRPGAGAWSAPVGRGGLLDGAAPGEPSFRLSLDRLDPLAASFAAAPQKAAAKDLVFVVHPDTLAVSTAVVGVRP